MMGLPLRRSLNAILLKLPPVVGARLRYRLGDRRDFYPFGTAMNGQTARLEMTRQILYRCGIEQIIETGTYRGTTTEWFAQLGLPIVTIEVNQGDFEFSRLRLGKWPHVRTCLGDSVEVLSSLRNVLDMTRRTFFYLDAHWQDYLPLSDEIALIAAEFPASVVMVDDFEVPSDARYGFDDYGPGKALTGDYLRACTWPNMEVFYPTTLAREETGERRGCVVLTSNEAMATELRAMPLLQQDVIRGVAA